MSELTLIYVAAEAIGYGRFGVNLRACLEKRNVDVYDHLDTPYDGVENTKPLDEPRDVLVPTIGAPDKTEWHRAKRTNVVCWAAVPAHCRGWWKGQHTVVFTMWEAMRLPEDFRAKFHEFDQILCPSTQNVELFSKYHDNVKRVLLGIDPVKWRYRERKPPDQFFNFLISGSGLRKGADIATKAFRKLWNEPGSWGDGPIPRLLIKSKKGGDFFGQNIELIQGFMPEEDERELYASAHCFLAPSRGEGFGLQPLQAIAQGCPTILTDAHGHESFAHLGYGLSWKPKESAYFIYGDAGDWWEPSLDDLCDRMKWVYDNYDKACAHAKHSSDIALHNWTWDNTASQFLGAIGPHVDAPYQGSEEWHKPEEKQFRVRLLQDWTADVGGIMHYFKKGEDYWQIADVKRVLFEAEILDPECVIGSEEHTGLSSKQIARVGAYTAQHSHCPTCGQMLNSGKLFEPTGPVYEPHR